MTNNQLTTERLEIMLAETLGTTAARGEQASIEVNASIFISVLTEALASRKAPDGYFSYGSEHCFEHHKTAKDAIAAAEAAIDDYRGDACDGWSEEVDSICWGVIMQSSTKVGVRPRTDDDSCDPSIDTVCDYALLPEVVHE